MHTDDQGKERVEILAPRLIEQYTKWGMEVPCYFVTQEMKEKNIRYLKLDELEKNPDFFTYIFKRTVYEINLSKCRCYWKDANDYIDAASEKRQKEESIQRTVTIVNQLCEEAKGSRKPLLDTILENLRKRKSEKEQALAGVTSEPIPSDTSSLDLSVGRSIEGMKNLSLSKTVTKTSSIPLKTLHRSKKPYHKFRLKFKKT